MGYQVMIPTKVQKKIKKMDASVQKLLYSYIKKNLQDSENPRIHGKPLTANLKGFWRYRILDYRLIVEIEDYKLIIVAVDFDHRDKIYRGMP